MGRKNILKDYVSVVSGNMASTSFQGPITTVNQFDVLSYFFEWSGGQATNGNIGLMVSLDNKSFYQLDFGQNIPTNSTSGEHQLLVKDVSFNYCYPFYTQTNGSATGTMKIELFATNKGA